MDRAAIEKLKKGFYGFQTRLPYSAYIHRCCHITDEYMWIIFIGDVAPPTNIWSRSKLNQTTHIFVGARAKPMNITLYSSVLGPWHRRILKN
jgi:hypothetical protein